MRQSILLALTIVSMCGCASQQPERESELEAERVRFPWPTTMPVVSTTRPVQTMVISFRDYFLGKEDAGKAIYVRDETIELGRGDEGFWRMLSEVKQLPPGSTVEIDLPWMELPPFAWKLTGRRYIGMVPRAVSEHQTYEHLLIEVSVRNGLSLRYTNPRRLIIDSSCLERHLKDMQNPGYQDYLKRLEEKYPESRHE